MIPPETVRFDVVSPINGRVLRVLQESAAVVQPGTPLLELGDTTDLEVEVDVLSTDAVQVQPGARVSVEHWGGEKPLNGFVQLIEPSGFTRVSALGVEEQRVNVIIKFDEPLERRQGLGDAFRVEARIVIWEADDIIKLPTSALFRDGENWAVFVATDGKAQLRHVEIGHRNSQEAEVVSGLKAGEVVIEHPADQIRSGVLIVPRGEEPTQGSD
ncbi:MAG: HlyD family efflux transporter periplasmic adaptor subunit [Planctomycetaceae bacterium]